MRNALICAGTMLALLLLWPILFGGTAASTASASAAGSTVSMTVPAPAKLRAPASRAIAPPPLSALPPLTSQVETCGATRVRARRLCSPDDAACAASVSDAYDICQARGLWPA